MADFVKCIGLPEQDNVLYKIKFVLYCICNIASNTDWHKLPYEPTSLRNVILSYLKCVITQLTMFSAWVIPQSHMGLRPVKTSYDLKLPVGFSYSSPLI